MEGEREIERFDLMVSLEGELGREREREGEGGREG